jgi:hypothetical protein
MKIEETVQQPIIKIRGEFCRSVQIFVAVFVDSYKGICFRLRN